MCAEESFDFEMIILGRKRPLAGAVEGSTLRLLQRKLAHYSVESYAEDSPMQYVLDTELILLLGDLLLPTRTLAWF